MPPTPAPQGAAPLSPTPASAPRPRGGLPEASLRPPKTPTAAEIAAQQAAANLAAIRARNQAE